MTEYIDRQALLENLRKSHRYHAGNSREESMLYRDIRIVDEQPAADVVPVVHGRWVSREGYDECNLCHNKSIYGHNYCPNCGARMDGE